MNQEEKKKEWCREFEKTIKEKQPKNEEEVIVTIIETLAKTNTKMEMIFDDGAELIDYLRETTRFAMGKALMRFAWSTEANELLKTCNTEIEIFAALFQASINTGINIVDTFESKDEFFEYMEETTNE